MNMPNQPTPQTSLHEKSEPEVYKKWDVKIEITPDNTDGRYNVGVGRYLGTLQDVKFGFPVYTGRAISLPLEDTNKDDFILIGIAQRVVASEDSERKGQTNRFTFEKRVRTKSEWEQLCRDIGNSHPKIRFYGGG